MTLDATSTDTIEAYRISNGINYLFHCLNQAVGQWDIPQRNGLATGPFGFVRAGLRSGQTSLRECRDMEFLQYSCGEFPWNSIPRTLILENLQPESRQIRCPHKALPGNRQCATHVLCHTFQSHVPCHELSIMS